MGWRRQVSFGVGALALLSVTVSPAGAEGGQSWETTELRVAPVGGGTVSVGGFGSVRGEVVVRPGGGVDAMLVTGLEDYVRGIAEVPTSWPSAALEAQAIAARTYALWTLASKRKADPNGTGPDICATESCQVFRGVAAEDDDGRWAAAVAGTTGRVLLHRGAVIPAFYSSSNGGLSWSRGAPYLPEVRDPDDVATSPWARWRAGFTLGDIARLFPGEGELTDVRTTDVVVLQRTLPDGGLRDDLVSPYTFRERLNVSLPAPAGVPVPVPSVRFSAVTLDGQVTLDGAGYGHLTGMSQYGALGKARRGLKADDILAAYYGGTRSTALRPEQLPANIRVSLVDGARSMQLTTDTPARVADGAGRTHELPAGTWTVRAAGSGLRVEGSAPVPPPASEATSASTPTVPAEQEGTLRAGAVTKTPDRRLPDRPFDAWPPLAAAFALALAGATAFALRGRFTPAA